jgi:hypothetical protein
MTEAEWLAATDPTLMLKFLRRRASDRKLRLFGVACCRRVWHVLDDEPCRTAVEVAERFADAEVTNDDRARAFRAACKVRDRHPQPTGRRSADDKTCAYYATSYVVAAQGVTAAGNGSAYVLQHFEWKDANRFPTERKQVRNLWLDVFGNPFRPAALDPQWLTSTVLALARQMYGSRDFSAMPILADALQDAGCDREEVLDHCRGPGLHVRGCWVVDLVLGKD